MENVQRVLAYQLAAPLSLDELEEVSGGGGFGSFKGTHKIEGNSATGPIVIADVAMDL